MKSNMSDNHKNKQNDATLLFEVGHTLIQTINRNILLFKGLFKDNPNSNGSTKVISNLKFLQIFELVDII